MKKRAKPLPAAIKNCLECGTPFRCTGFRVAGPQERKFCGAICMHAHKRLSPTSADRLFWPQVQKGDGCWLWQGRKDKSGYGRYGRAGEYVYPHRIAWLFTNGDIPADMEVAHTCDVRACCNPAHLFLATHDENMADCKAKGRQVRGEKSIHAKLTAAQVLEIRNTYWYKRAAKGVPRIYASNAKELAAKYGVTVGTIAQAALGKRWGSL